MENWKAAALALARAIKLLADDTEDRDPGLAGAVMGELRSFGEAIGDQSFAGEWPSMDTDPPM